jgi:beta-lactamase class A
MLRLLMLLAAFAAPPAPPHGQVAVSVPRSYEIWDGRVAGRVPAGTEAISVRAGKHRWVVPVGRKGRFSATVGPVPWGDEHVQVAGVTVAPVYGVPEGSVRPLEPPRNDRRLAAKLAVLAHRASPHVGIYAWKANGEAAAYNAGAQFEAASTLKLPVMITALSGISDELSTTPYWDPFTRITRYSDNVAANQVLELMAGSEEAGAARMVAFVKSLGLTGTFMEGGYLTGDGGGRPGVSIVDPPPTAYKHTTPADMARLAGDLVAAAAGRGPLIRKGVSAHEARELLYLMLHAEDPGLVPAGAHGLPVAHKIGWLEDADNDVAIVFAPVGPAVITIYTVGAEDSTTARFGADATSAVLAAR